MRSVIFPDHAFARCVARTALSVVTALLGLGCGMSDAELVEPTHPALGCQTVPTLSTEPFAAAATSAI